MPLSPQPIDTESLLREIHQTFEALAEKIDYALECLPSHEEGGEDWRRLHRAKQAVQKGQP